jgi:hypothetical protein
MKSMTGFWNRHFGIDRENDNPTNPVMLAHEVYLLESLGVLAGVPALFGLFNNYVKRSVVKGWSKLTIHEPMLV